MGRNELHRHVHLRADCGRETWLAGRGATATRRGAAGLGCAENIDEKGNVREVCVGTNQKDDTQYYLDRPRAVGDLHGQAPVLWCAWALLEK